MEVLISWDVYYARNSPSSKQRSGSSTPTASVAPVCSQNIDTALPEELRQGDGIDLRADADEAATPPAVVARLARGSSLRAILRSHLRRFLKGTAVAAMQM